MNNFMLRKIFVLTLILIGISSMSQAQESKRPQPKIWFGVSGAANLNFYSGTTQMLNSTLTAPGAFHNGFGVAPYASVFLEYRPTPVVGFMLNVGYDGRGGTFKQVMAPCNCPEYLRAMISYLSIEPSLRISPFASGLYMYIGGGYSRNIGQSFIYKQELQTDKEGDFSSMRKDKISGHIGIGYDIPVSSANSLTQVTISPFVSYSPYFGQHPRSVESWSLSTLRAGIAIKFGKARPTAVVVPPPAPYIAPAPPVFVKEIQFTIETPVRVPVRRVVKETFPLRNYVFFDEKSTEIPNRYVLLKRDNAISFKEGMFQEPIPKDLPGRSNRQLTVYYNILNIVGDRMRTYPTADLVLIGASAGNGPELGKSYAESVKMYLVDVFGINPSRITTEGRNEPIIRGEQPGGTKYLVLLREGDRRVDLVSNSPFLLAPLQITSVQQDPVDSRIIFKTEAGSKEYLKTWSLQIINEKGDVQRYGPFTKSNETISGNLILGDRSEGDFKVIMLGETKEGNTIRRESTLRLVRNEAPKEIGLRFSILFDFDKSKAVAEYEKFLNEVVAPLVPDYGTVIIHGHTDIIGEADYNMNLSQERALDARTILEKALVNAGKKGVKFESYGFGSDESSAPFDNKRPEERFYNRTVIIDIVPNN